MKERHTPLKQQNHDQKITVVSGYDPYYDLCIHT